MSGVQVTQPAAEEKVMPALLWIAFWSSLMATAACFGEMSRAGSIDKRARTGALDAQSFPRNSGFPEAVGLAAARPSAWLPRR